MKEKEAYEPLNGKRKSRKYADSVVIDCFDEIDVKSAVEGLIQYHESIIEKFAKLLSTTPNISTIEEKLYLNMMEVGYEFILTIQHWLEDVIE